MLSLSLGLIISSAAFQLFSHSIRTQKLQLSVADIQDTAVFGFSTIKKQIAHANLGASQPMKQQSAWTGIVLTGSEEGTELSKAGKPLKVGNLKGVRGIKADFLTKNNAGPSNLITPISSDQLTIQYRAPFDSHNCEGRRVNKGDMIIERYFTRTDRQRANNETKALAIVLACDAGSYQLDEQHDANELISDSMMLKDFGDNGVILINRVDYFSVKLGVKLAQGLAYMPIATYLNQQSSTTSPTLFQSNYVYDAPIVAIEIGIISRSMTNLGEGNGIKVETAFNLHGEDYQIKEKSPHYIRRTLQSVVSLRNSQLNQ